MGSKWVLAERGTATGMRKLLLGVRDLTMTEVFEMLGELGKEWEGTQAQKGLYRALKARQRELSKREAAVAFGQTEMGEYLRRRRLADAKARGW